MRTVLLIMLNKRLHYLPT